jgi:hypothetical protein
MHQSVRKKFMALNNGAGIKLTPQQLGNGSAALMADARKTRMHAVTSMAFAKNPDTGQINTARVYMFEGDPKSRASHINVTNMAQVINTPAEQS